MARGSKPGERRGGRQKGTPNKRTVEAIEKAAEVAKTVEAVLPSAFAGDAHAFLMTVYKDPNQELAVRLDAAGKAIKFETPALSSVDRTGEAARKAVVRIPHKAETPDEWQRLYSPTTRPN